MTSPVLEVSRLVKDYRGLRPLRIERLSVAPAEQVAIIGMDQPAAETFINLITGASLPDQGAIRAFGRTTSELEDSAAWLAFVDRFGLLTDRAVLLEPLTVLQNLALPFSLDLEPVPDDVRSRAAALARDVGVEDALWNNKIIDLEGAVRARVRLGRALALDPEILVLEHPTAAIEPESRSGFARDVRALADRRRIATLTLTMDAGFAQLVASRVFTLNASTGRLSRK